MNWALTVIQAQAAASMDDARSRAIEETRQQAQVSEIEQLQSGRTSDACEQQAHEGLLRAEREAHERELGGAHCADVQGALLPRNMFDVASGLNS